MDIRIENGDHAVDGRGLPMRIQGAAKEAQSAMIRLAVRRGSLVPDKTLGSMLHTLPGADDALAQSYVQDALSGMPGVRVHEVRCAYDSAGNTLSVHVELGIDEERYTAQVNMRSYDEFLDSMKETYRTLSGFDADDASDIGIRLKVLAHELCKLDAGVDYLMLQAFPDTAQGQHLDMHARMRSLFRKQAVAARGNLRFSRENLSEDDTVIPAGTLCSTRAADELRFETVEECVIPAGGYHAVAAAAASQAGSLYNIAPAAVGVLITPVPGIAAVTNPERFSGGEDAESDESLRSRLLEGYLAVSNGANSAFYHSLAMQHEGIASVRVLPRERGRGTVDVVLSGYGSAPPQELIDEIQADMAAQREINVDVSVYAAQARVADIAVEIGIDDAGDFAQVSALCDAAIREAVNSARVGEPLRLCELGDAVYSCKGVANYRIISPAEDVRPTAKQIVRLGALTLMRMEVV